ncbi:TPA: hypothetical protein ACHYLO_004289, partial [Escherichia coli]
ATTVEWCTPQLLLGSQLPLFSYRASTATLLFICSGQQKLVTISDFSSIYFPIRSAVIHRYIHEAGVHYKSVCVNRLLYVAIKPVLVT